MCGGGLDALLRHQEGHDHQHQGDAGEEGDGADPPVLIVTSSETVYQREGESLYHELGDGDGDEADGGDARTLLDVAGHHTAQGGVGDVVEGVGRHHQHVGDGGVDGYRRLLLDAGIIEREYIEHAEGDGRPQHPRAELAPSGVGAVGEKAHRWIHDDGRDTSNHKNTARHSTIKAEDVRIELQLEDHHHLEYEISGDVS